MVSPSTIVAMAAARRLPGVPRPLLSEPVLLSMEYEAAGNALGFRSRKARVTGCDLALGPPGAQVA